MDQEPDAEGSFTWNGACCEEVPLSGSLATDGLDPCPALGRVFF